MKKIELKYDDIVIADAEIGQKELFRNLVNLQFHDLSEYRDNFDILDDGRYEWTFEGCFAANNKHHHPLLIKKGNKIAGFIIFSDYGGESLDTNFMIVEMFILRRYRNRGIGTKAFEILVNNFNGRYKLEVSENNLSAVRFWNGVINKFGSLVKNEKFTEENNRYLRYYFDTKQ